MNSQRDRRNVKDIISPLLVRRLKALAKSKKFAILMAKIKLSLVNTQQSQTIDISYLNLFYQYFVIFDISRIAYIS